MQPTKNPELASPSTLAWWSCPGIVYFLVVGNPPIAVKIGMLAITSKVTLQSAMARRLSNIQSSNHELVQVIGVIHFIKGEYPTRDAENCERRLHLDFEHLVRFKAGTRGAEWFNASPALLERISQVAVLPESLGLPRTVGAIIARQANEA